jgi:hypothetical protein
MQFDYSYRRSSKVANDGKETAMSFSPDTTREPTFFRGALAKKLSFREAISALHDVVVSDLRYKPKDREEYKRWLEQQDFVVLSEVEQQRAAVAAEINDLTAEMRTLQAARNERMRPYYKAQRRYFDYLYKKDLDAWYVLDPVITVHPDEIFFECFSEDESSYGRLGASYEGFDNIGEFACGTTNIDYSQALYDEFQKIRTYKSTSLEVDPSGFEVKTTQEESFKEVKIDLPDSWVRGFLQVSSAMSLPAITFDLHPLDVHNICFVLRRNKELHGPRSMRYVLRPGRPVSVVFDPWGKEIVCPRSEYRGRHETEVRVWGRRRIHILERLIPIAKRFRVNLLGTGMPSFYVADLGHMSFTLGLSGWTRNDWSQSGNFDLMASREEVDSVTKQQIFTALKSNWSESLDALSSRLSMDSAVVASALNAYTQAGRVIYDLNKSVYRVRELSRDPLPMDKLRFSNEREQSATDILYNGDVSAQARGIADGAVELVGRVRHRGKHHETSMVLDPDRRMVRAECDCNYYRQNKLYKGPCEHLLAMRLAHQRGQTSVIEVHETDRSAAQLAPGYPSASSESPAQSRQEPEAAKKRGWFARAWRSISGKPATPAAPVEPADVTMESAIANAVSELSGSHIVATDDTALAAELLAACRAARKPRARASMIMAALQASDHVDDIVGDDADILRIIQDALKTVTRD